MKIKAFLAAISLFVAGTLMAQSTTEPKREFRSSWIAGINIDFAASLGESGIKARLTQYLDAMQAQHFTGVCFHVRSHGDAYYRSSLEPWSQYISGTRGKDPGWDPLEWMVTECHKRGMECYAWVNPFRVSTSGILTSTSFDQQWNNNGWLLKGTANTSYVVFNPGIAAARKHCLDVIKDIYTRYNVDGMLFDDYFYPSGGTAEDSSAGDYTLWKNSGTKLSIGDWRRENVNTFVKEVYDAIKADRPDMRFGIGPAGVAGASGDKYGVGRPNITSSDWMYAQIYCDPLAWLSEGTIDFVSPQIYWQTTHSTAPFGPLTEWYDKVCTKFNRHLYVSAGAYRLGEASSSATYIGGNTTTGWSELANQVKVTRQNTDNGSCGMIWYSTRWINGPTTTGLGDYLQENTYTKPSLVPVLTWKDAPAYSAPAGLKQSGTKLSWTATAGAKANSIIRYTVYAVPDGVPLNEAADANGDGISAQYLLGVTYDPSYTLASADATGHWYAVCVYDGYGNESEPALLNYVTKEPAAKPQLVAPAAGSTFGYTDINFSWKVDDATGIDSYTLEICKKGNGFASVLYKTTVTGTTATVAASQLGEGTFDWHVKAAGAEVETSVSDLSSFTVAKEPAAKPQLIAPAADATFGDVDIEFAWKVDNATGIDSYTLEICKSGNGFAKLLHTATVKGTTATVAARKLGEGTFDWRVKAAGAEVKTSVSDLSSFIVAGLPFVPVEGGYSPVTDGSTYDIIGDVAIESLWFRSTKEGFDNMNEEFDVLADADNKGLQRGMVATADAVYVTRRSANSAAALPDIFLDKYDPQTGEFLGSIVLDKTTAATHSLFPNNDVIKDKAGNIVISNLTTNVISNNIYLYQVNTETGELTCVASLGAGGSTTYRVDHVGIHGDVTSGEFYVFAAVANSKYILRWDVTDAEETTNATVYTVQSFYPTSAGSLGIAPRVRPVASNQVWVDGGSTAMTLYNLTSSTRRNRANASATFSSATDLEPVNTLDNGGALFTFKSTPYMVYNVEPSSSALDCYGKFNVVKMNSASSLSGIQKMWTIPAEGIGGTNSTTSGAPVDCVEQPDNSVNIYLYSPTNGLAAYRVCDANSTGIDDILADKAADAAFSVTGRTVSLEGAAGITAYSLSGAVVATSAGDSLTLPAPGAYIVAAGPARAIIAVK